MHDGAGFQLTSAGGRPAIIPQSFQARVEAQAEATVLAGAVRTGHSLCTQGWQEDTHPHPRSPFTSPTLARQAFSEDPLPFTLEPFCLP